MSRAADLLQAYVQFIIRQRLWVILGIVVQAAASPDEEAKKADEEHHEEEEEHGHGHKEKPRKKPVGLKKFFTFGKAA